MSEKIVGVDIGGTKTQIAVSVGSELVASAVRTSAGWTPSPAADARRWLEKALDQQAVGWRDAAALVVGAHGCDSGEVIRSLREEFVARLGIPCLVVNDAELILPAMSLQVGVGLIAGTGSVAAGSRPDGTTTVVGGWGWLLGDEGSAPSIVRAAVRTVMLRHEQGQAPDPLTSCMLTAFGAANPEDLPTMVSRTAGKVAWGGHAPLVFQAASDGSVSAAGVIERAGRDLAALVTRLHQRGVDTGNVVLAGGVLQSQPLLVEAVRAALDASGSTCHTQVLTDAPVTGALALGHRLLGVAAEPTRVPTSPGLDISFA